MRVRSKEAKQLDRQFEVDSAYAHRQISLFTLSVLETYGAPLGAVGLLSFYMSRTFTLGFVVIGKN